jgi:cyanophycinase
MSKKNNSCPVPKGVLVIIGGKENKGEEDIENRKAPDSFMPLEILRTVVELIKKDHPVVEVVTTASGSPEESFEEYKKLFKELGVSKVGHIQHVTRKEILQQDLTERVSKADAVFFTGGDQLKLTSLYGGTPFLTSLKERYIHEKIVVAGTSAGAMAMSTPMIYAGEKEVEEISGEIRITTGLEFLKDVCIDTHFVNRGRFVRMAQVVVTNPTAIGIGIGEDTAIVVRNGLEAEVIGSGMIIVIDGFHIAESNVNEFAEKKTTVTIKDLRVHILGCEEKFTIPQANPPHH